MNDGDLTIADTVMLENKIEEYKGKKRKEKREETRTGEIERKGTESQQKKKKKVRITQDYYVVSHRNTD